MPNQTLAPNLKSALLRILRATATLPAQVTFYASALGAIALIPGAELPPALAAIASGVGVNVLSNMLERIARGERIPDDEIRQGVQSAIEESQIATHLAIRDTRSLIARQFRRLDLLQLALQENQGEILQRLAEQATQFDAFVDEWRDEVQKLSTREQSDQALALLRRIEGQLSVGQRAPLPQIDATVDFVIVTALEEERDAVLDKLPGYRQLKPSPDDIRTYYVSELPVTFPDGSTGSYTVVVMPLLDMGQAEAITATSDAIHKWNPRYILLVGIAGGVAGNDARLGDLLVSDQIVYYELQKLTSKGPQMRGQVYRTDPRMLGAVRAIRGDRWQGLLTKERPDDGAPARLIGPVASGNKVIATSDVVKGLLDDWPKLIGVEMEAAGVAIAAFQAVSQPGVLMVRGVSDLADEEKNVPEVKRWRAYACDVAAAYTIALLQSGPVVPRERKKLVDPPPKREPLPTPGAAPPPPTVFVGRGGDMDALYDRLKGQETPTLLTAVRGWPGVGKTALASALAHDGRIKRAFRDGVLWTALGPKSDPTLQLGQWLTALGEEPRPYPTVEGRSARLAALLRNRQMLLIVDDVWEATHARPFCVGGSQCRTIITTRHPEVARDLGLPDRAIYRLPVLPEEDARTLLHELAPRAVESEPDGIRRLIRKLDGLPLALQVAGRLLAAETAMGWGVSDLLDELAAGTRILEAKAPADRSDVARQTTPTVAALFQNSTDRLDAVGRDQFALLAAFVPKPATFDAAAAAALWDVDDARPALRLLVDRGLLEPAAAGRFQVHALLAMHAHTLCEE